MSESSHPPPRIDSWPAKSPDAKLDALLPLAKTIAKKIARRCPSRVREEILAAATIGAWEVVRRHPELDRNAAQRLAVIRVRGAILDELRQIDHLPRRVRAGIKRGELPDMPMVHFEHTYHVGDKPEPVPESLQTPARQLDAIESAQQAAADGKRLCAAMEALEPRIRAVLVDYYFTGDTLGVIAKRMGVSEPRVAQIRKQGVAQLKELWLKS